MKVSELRELYEKNKGHSDINVKKHVSIAAISAMVKMIVDGCTDINADGLLEVDLINKKLNTDIAIMFHYAEIEFPDGKGLVADYDWMVESGLYDIVMDRIDGRQYFLLLELIDEEIEQRKELTNSIEASVAKLVIAVEKGIDAVIKKLPSKKQLSNLIKEAGGEFKNFDPDKLEVLGGLLDKLKV